MKPSVYIRIDKANVVGWHEFGRHVMALWNVGRNTAEITQQLNHDWKSEISEATVANYLAYVRDQKAGMGAAA
ncbi:hypothetical protein [Enterovirga sp. CN4-39]|uniref:hypothetical protein n=1 Tax=Enterovirga sp. CN4-39 TaxID=3400910 RepID=UPI003C0024B8